MIFIDQIGGEVELRSKPLRIISIVPSQTEFLYDIGLEDEVVGITKFCLHPNDWFRNKARVGGTKTVDLQKVRDLKPDLIIGNKEENDKANIEALREIAPVWMSDIANLEEAYSMMLQIGQMVGKEKESLELIEKIQFEFDTIKPNHSYQNFVLHLEVSLDGGRKGYIHR